MAERISQRMSQRQFDKKFDQIVKDDRLDTAAQDVRVGWLVGYTHRGEVDLIPGPAEYMELTAQIAESYELEPDEMSTVIGRREDQEFYEQA